MSPSDASPNAARSALRTMGRARARLGASLDARQSIEMVGNHTARAQGLEPTLDPIGVARDWLAARSELDDEVRTQATAALDAAAALMRDIDTTAGAIARDARTTGAIPDPMRIAEVEQMASTLATFCSELHLTLCEVEAETDSAARARLSAAAAVAQASGGIAAATVILSASR